MNAGLHIDRWRTATHRFAGFRQFCREWSPEREVYLPLLMLHGSLTQSGMWIALARAARSIRMLCPDQRGFGRSDDPGGDSCAEFASDALALAKNLLPERYVVMAHSFACSIALEVAHRAAAQVAAVVLVDPVVRTAAPPPAVPVLPPAETFATIEDACRHFRESEEGEWTDGTLRHFVEDIMMRDGETAVWRFPYAPERLQRLRAFTASPASDYDLFAKAKAVRCPVLVFRGGMSKRFPAEVEQPFLQAFATKPTLVVCPTSGHFPSATEPDIMIEGLKRFLDGVR